MKLREIADRIGGSVIGDAEVDITGVSSIRDAQTGSVTFVADQKNLRYIYSTKASAVITREKIQGAKVNMLIVDNPHLAFAKTLELFYKKPYSSLGIRKEAIIGKNVSFGNDVSIHPMVYIGDNVTIGNRTVIFPTSYIGNNVVIGDNSVIYPNVSIMDNVQIGKNVIIHPGSVVGSDGFGYAREKEKHYKIPQVGGVIIEDDVEIGASVTIDRATLGNTLIGQGTKIDNLVQIAHNVKTGKNCLIISQTGISGRVELGDSVIIAGQTGIADHVTIGDGVIVIGKSGVTGNLKHGVYSGMPAIPHKEWLKAQSIYGKLPELLKRLRELENKIKSTDTKTEH
jgi:UDP-3-O-[3-hydroxymyristoyl] glucosamine N-acyltransferase